MSGNSNKGEVCVVYSRRGRQPEAARVMKKRLLRVAKKRQQTSARSSCVRFSVLSSQIYSRLPLFCKCSSIFLRFVNVSLIKYKKRTRYRNKKILFVFYYSKVHIYHVKYHKGFCRDDSIFPYEKMNFI